MSQGLKLCQRRLLACVLLTFVKAASSVFMKARNSFLESVQLSPSRPAYRWKTASSDSMQRSVSVGCRSKSKLG